MNNRNLMIIGGGFLLVVVIAVIVFTSGVTNEVSPDEGAQTALNAEVGDQSPSSPAKVIETIYSDLSQAKDGVGGDFEATRGADQITMVETATGRETAVIRESAPNEVLFSGTVANLSDVDAAHMAQINKRIEDLNGGGLDIGTLRYDPATHRVILEHRVNPQETSPQKMADAAVRFSSRVRSLSSQMQQEAVAANP